MRPLKDRTGSDVNEILLEIQNGDFPDASIVWKFGRHENIGATRQPIWDGEAAYVYPTTAATITIESTLAADNTEVTVQGLDENWNDVSVELTLDGTNQVSSTEKFIRIARAYNSNGTEFVGDILIKQGTNLLAKIQPEHQQTLMTMYTVPEGYKAHLFQGTASTSKLKDSQIFYKVKLFGGVFRTQETFGLYQNSIESSRPYLTIPAKSDIEVSASSSSAGTDVSAQFGIILIKEP